MPLHAQLSRGFSRVFPVIYLSIFGLSLDLLGVVLLGVDLVRAQRRIRSDASERLAKLDAILEGIGGMDGWAETVRSDFRDWDLDEGRVVMLPGTFDAGAARESFRDVAETIGVVGVHVLTLANMQMAAIDSDKSAANVSLKYSYAGLALIVVGFSLQLAAYIPPVLSL